MDKYIFDKSNGHWYELIGDYYYICAISPEKGKETPNIWAQRHLKYIKNYQKALYKELYQSGELITYLQNVEEEASTMFMRLVDQLAEKEGITGELKSTDSQQWIRRMNNICSQAREFVNHEIIFV